MRDVDTRFTSDLVVAGEDFKSIKELQGKRFSFGSRLAGATTVGALDDIDIETCSECGGAFVGLNRGL
jgi:hypothetical protein